MPHTTHQQQRKDPRPRRPTPKRLLPERLCATIINLVVCGGGMVMARSLFLFALSRLSCLSPKSPTSVTSSSFRSFSGGSSIITRSLPTLAMTTTSSSSSSSSTQSLVVDDFCFRQFAEHEASQSYGGTVFSISVAEFERIVNARFDETQLQDGYAPFCKHLFVENDFTDAVVNVLKITPENEGLLRTKYEARNDQELPVLVRWFPKDLVGNHNLPKAPYLDLILYSRAQIQQESAAQGRPAADTSTTAPWGIVSIKAQDAPHELPMTPITAMRNALGKEEGGSGMPLDREAYLHAVQYWAEHANVS